AAPPAAPVDFRELGHVRQQPEGEVLCHHEGRAETARRAGGELGTDLHGDHADAPPGGSVAPMRAWLAVLSSRIRGLLSTRSLDDDFNRELSVHLAMLTEDNLRRGMTPDEARRAAIVRLGGPMQIKERQRDARGLPL